MKWFLCALSSLCVIVSPALVWSKTVSVRSESTFYNLLDKKPFAVALFYQEGKRKSDVAEQARDLKSLMRETSTRGFYKDAGLQFLEVNVDKPELSAVADDYAVAKVPAVLLFDDGKPVRNNEQTVALYGAPTQRALRNFIDDNLEEKLSKRIDDQAKQRASCCRDAIYYGPYYWGGYAGWPYYDNYPYNQWCGYPGYNYGTWGGGCGGRVGFGVSWGF